MTTATVTYDPVGVVGVISPWNYPLTLSMADALPALVAGNAVVLKPDEKTPYGALALGELLEVAGLPDDLFQVVTGDGPTVGPALIDAVDYVAFTGSTETGRIVAERAGRNLIDCSLELGGNNPSSSSTTPTSTRRPAARYRPASRTLGSSVCRRSESMSLSRPTTSSSTRSSARRNGSRWGPVTTTTPRSARSSTPPSSIGSRTTSTTRGSAARRRADGAAAPNPTAPPYYEPTILTDVEPDATVACEETFGPVVSVAPVPDADAAVAAANDSPYGLNASVWTRGPGSGAEIARDIDCGTVNVNDAFLATWGAVDAPMGGFGDSGMAAATHARGDPAVRRVPDDRGLARRSPPSSRTESRSAGSSAARSRRSRSAAGEPRRVRRLKERIRLR